MLKLIICAANTKAPSMPINGTRLSSARCATRRAATARVVPEASHISSPVPGDSNASAMCIEFLRRGEDQDRAAPSITKV